jgi:signal transduction histidine kinase
VDDRTGAGRNATRDRLVDGGLVAFATAIGLWAATNRWQAVPGTPPWVLYLDCAAGVVGCLALWWRRRFPLVTTTMIFLLCTFAASTSLASLVALFTVAAHRSARATVVAAVASVPVSGAYLLVRSGLPASWTTLAVLHVVLGVTVAVWGRLVQSRRELIASLRERAAASEVEARLRAERAQHEAREALAREMHDVLGHRLSLLSVSAGALVYGRGATVEEIARAAEAVRENARGALQDLREVIGVLRAPEGDIPLPGVQDVVELVDDGERSGTPVQLQDLPGVTTGDRLLPDTAGRTVYRLVQEGLTNARKHAPGAPVVVRITGERGAHLDVEVVNGPAAAPPEPAIGSGEGLRGLAERATLVGGRVEHGPTGSGGWRLRMRLRWPA